MRFDGEWLSCDDGIVRPVIRGEVLAADGSWKATEFLIDTGADRTVFSFNVCQALGLESNMPTGKLGGVGGLVDFITAETEIRLTRETGAKVVFRGAFAGCETPEALDISVIGRDLLNMLVVIVDRPSEIVCFLKGKHHYIIKE